MDPDTPMTDTSAAEADTRGADGRFLPGRSGNALGRPVGSRRVLGLARALAQVGGIAVVLDPRRPARPTSATSRRPRRIAA